MVEGSTICVCGHAVGWHDATTCNIWGCSCDKYEKADDGE